MRMAGPYFNSRTIAARVVVLKVFQTCGADGPLVERLGPTVQQFFVPLNPPVEPTLVGPYSCRHERKAAEKTK